MKTSNFDFTVTVKNRNDDGVKEKIDALKNEIKHDKNQDIVKFKDEIREALEGDIISRYYLQKGNIEHSFNHDVDVKEALRLAGFIHT